MTRALINALLFLALGAAALPNATADDPVVLAEFSSDSDLNWVVMNDPVMGGQSTSDFDLDTDAAVLSWSGTCAIVPSLKAPGFCTLETQGQILKRLPDASACTHLTLSVRCGMPYSGFKVDFATSEHHDVYPSFSTFKARALFGLARAGRRCGETSRTG